MTDRELQSAERRAWLAVAGLALAIYATVPLARAIQRAVQELAGRQLFLVIVLLGLALALVAVLRRLRRSGGRPIHAAVWSVTVLAYAAMAWSLRRAPEEALHLLEYGALGVALWHALRFRIADAWVFPAAALLGATFGMLDEAVQWLTPERHWDLRDVALNAGAAAGVQPALAFGVPRLPARPAARPGRRLALACGGVAWLVLGASLLNTPSRIAALSGWAPGFAAARERGDLMIEYGFLHRDPEAGWFHSRFRLPELRTLDRERAPEAGAILAAEGGDDVYPAFLRRYNPITDPFLHELRVHLFRRDRYLETAARHRAEGDPAWARRDETVARHEDAILSRYFGRTLEAGGRTLPDPIRRHLAQEAPFRPDYRSPVSRGLITRLPPRTVLLTWLAGLALLLTWTARSLTRGSGVSVNSS